MKLVNFIKHLLGLEEQGNSYSSGAPSSLDMAILEEGRTHFKQAEKNALKRVEKQ